MIKYKAGAGLVSCKLPEGPRLLVLVLWWSDKALTHSRRTEACDTVLQANGNLCLIMEGYRVCTLLTWATNLIRNAHYTITEKRIQVVKLVTFSAQKS